MEEEKKEAKEEKTKKKVVRKRKSRKEKEMPMIAALRMLVESGKAEFGVRSTMKNISSKKAKAVVISSNAPQEVRKNAIERCSKEGIELIEFNGSSLQLGAACGKPFIVSILSVIDTGTSNILELVSKKK